MSFENKYRVHEVAKDFGKQTKDITQILTTYATAPKNHMQVLSDKELSIVFEYMTQHNQVADMQASLATAPKGGENRGRNGNPPLPHPGGDEQSPGAKPGLPGGGTHRRHPAETGRNGSGDRIHQRESGGEQPGTQLIEPRQERAEREFEGEHREECAHQRREQQIGQHRTGQKQSLRIE